MNIELRHCPICGKLPKLCRAYHDYKYFCGTHVSCGDWKRSVAEAALDWNRRTTDRRQPDLYRPTHFDTLRAATATPEKMAKELLVIGSEIPFCKHLSDCYRLIEECGIPEEMCLKCLVDWLNRPEGEMI